MTAVEWTAELERLEHDDGPQARLLAGGVRSALSEPEGLAKAWVQKIEGLRSDLKLSTETVPFIDYGAGKPGSGRSPQQMEQGVRTTLTVGELAGGGNTLESWGRLLFHLVSSVRPVSCLELGTRIGISGAYQAAALQRNGSGRLTSIEGAPAVADIARSNFRRLGLDNVDVLTGRFRDVLPSILDRVRSVDFAFIDGHHDEKATLGYVSQIRPCLNPGGILLFDDIRWYAGVHSAWQTISTGPSVRMSIDFGRMGLCVIGEPQGRPSCYNLLCLPETNGSNRAGP